MKLKNLVNSYSLFEAKARIEHPEDLIFDQGLNGAVVAIHALQTTAKNPESVSLKLDGSPALIFGWLGDQFVLTDKWGFRSKSYDGLTTSPEAIKAMILSRKIEKIGPDTLHARRQYAEEIARLYPILKAATPDALNGYAQGDLMWTSVPRIEKGNYVFRKNKITYRIPVDSEIGSKIANSKIGISIHSLWKSPDDDDPLPIRHPVKLGFREVDGLVILPHEVHFHTKFHLNHKKLQHLHHVLKHSAGSIKEFFNQAYLGSSQIKSLPKLMKRFVAHKAALGENDFSRVGEEFLHWISGPVSPVTGSMQNNILSYVQTNINGYNAVWHIVKLITDLKTDLKQQMDSHLHGVVSGELAGEQAQEGYVSVTPDAVIKLVDRPKFMKKGVVSPPSEETPTETPPPVETPEEPASNDTSATKISEDDKKLTKPVVWTFIRANPPHIGHLKLFHKMKKIAEKQGADWFIFLSQSQDSKKNPLGWQDKISFIEKLMPDYAEHISHNENIKTPLSATDWLYNQGYRKMIMVVGDDRLQTMKDLLNSWNSDGITAQYLRSPVKLAVVSAGERDDADNGIKGTSSTKARHQALYGNLNGFKHAVGFHGNTATQLYHAVRQGQNRELAESANLHKDGTIVMLKMHPHSAQQLNEWCNANNIPCLHPEDLHITILLSKHPVPHLESMHGNNVRVVCKPLSWKKLGESALVLVVDGEIPNQFHKSLIKQGGTHDYAEYIPHTSVSYDWKWNDFPVKLPEFPLVYDTIHVAPNDPDWSAKK